VAPPHYASPEAYLAYLATFSANPTEENDALKVARQFQGHYPDLQQWLAAPLVERIGRRYEEPWAHPSYPQSYRARSYLIFLAASGYMRLDWEWLLATPTFKTQRVYERLGCSMGIPELIQLAKSLGYHDSAAEHINWIVSRLGLHTGATHYSAFTEDDLNEAREAIRLFGARADVALFFGSRERYKHRAPVYLSHVHTLHVLLYHLGHITTEPQRSSKNHAPPRLSIHPQIDASVTRYIAERRLTYSPASVSYARQALHMFQDWLAQAYPSVESFAGVTRDQVLEYAEALKTYTCPRTGKLASVIYRIRLLSCLKLFFQYAADSAWPDCPPRPLLLHADILKRPQRVPRFIPEDELARLMDAVRALEDIYQRAALLIARWSGARRGEISRLRFDCLDSYPDGTPRLHIPVGKTNRERMIPLNEEAAQAIRELRAHRQIQERGFRDTRTGVVTRYLFVKRGQRLLMEALFNIPLTKACQQAGLLDERGKATITPHRFRHTVGTQLAERGARLHTIMRVLGHESPQMSMVYATISDKEVLKDYQAVLAPGATIAGPFAEALHNNTLAQSAVDWLKTNFFKTELELGRCLRLPEEGPCECDLYLTCSKFVTTPEYAPQLRRRRQVELELIEDAIAHGWQREVERHQCTVRRLEDLLADLGEPLNGSEST
jgi:integrase